MVTILKEGYCQEKDEDDGAKESTSNGHVLGAGNLLSEDLLHSKEDHRQGDGHHAGHIGRQGWKWKPDETQALENTLLKTSCK